MRTSSFLKCALVGFFAGAVGVAACGGSADTGVVVDGGLDGSVDGRRHDTGGGKDAAHTDVKTDGAHHVDGSVAGDGRAADGSRGDGAAPGDGGQASETSSPFKPDAGTS